MKKIIAKAREMVTPPEHLERLEEAASYSLARVKEETAKFEQIVGVEIGGSYAKGTWLESDTDIDIFIKFVDTTPKEEFVKISQEIGFAAMKECKPYTRYSEHPYVEAEVRQTKINIVPCYDVEPGRWMSSADRSPHHTKKIQALSTEEKNDVRLLKAFLRYAGIYGAEIAKQGFSGYVSEILILNFGSFENVIKQMSEIEKNHVIGETDEKFKTPIVIIDPIDKKRNLAAAISEENIGKFILRCRAFQKNPSVQFFEQSKRKLTNSENLVVVNFKFELRSPETVWGQIKKTSTSLATQLGLEGFNVLRNTAYANDVGDAWLLFLLESTTIPETRVRKGPEFFSKDYTEIFIEKNVQKSELMWLEKGRIVITERRKYKEVVACLEDLLKGDQGKLKGLREDFGCGFQISIGTDLLNESVKETAIDLITTDDTFIYFN